MKKSIVAVTVAILLIIAGIAIACSAFIITDFSLDGFTADITINGVKTCIQTQNISVHRNSGIVDGKG